MADLQVCYFCGSGPDDSLGEYAVVPSDLDPTDEQQRSVVLCPSCREKLTRVMEPVVDAAAGDAEPAGRGSDPGGLAGATAGDESTSGDDPTPPAEISGRSGPDESTEASGRSGPDESVDDDVTMTGSGFAGEDDAPGDGADEGISFGTGGADRPGDADEASASQDADDSGSTDSDESPGAGVAGSTDAPTDAGTTTSADAGADAGADEGASAEPDGEAAGSSSGSPRGAPHTDDELVGRNNQAYNKTLRLLQNREFPVERHEIEQVAANAYQLDPQEVSDAIDALIRKGLLTQEGAQLVRP